MAASDAVEALRKRAARRAYERGRLEGALMRGAAAVLLATPGFLVCGQTPAAAACLAGFALVVAAGRFRGEAFDDGASSGAIAGILPCLLPATIGGLDPRACMLLASSQGLWICGAGGVAAGVILALRSRPAAGLAFWGSALAALGFVASIGCLPAGAIGFTGLVLGVVAGGAPALVLRRALP